MVVEVEIDSKLAQEIGFLCGLVVETEELRMMLRFLTEPVDK